MSNARDVEIPTQPGQCVSVDQIVSPTPGLVAQERGILMIKHYKYATVFVDQATDFTYIYLQVSATADETIEAKDAFECKVESMGFRVKHYHANNGVFAMIKWRASCYGRGQGLTFAGIDAHHQNGVAERRIRELQDMAQTMLIHAHRRWPSVITANFWPYAIRMAAKAYNYTLSTKFKDARTLIEGASGTKVTTNAKHWQPLGCPAYELDPALRSGARIHQKWKP